ncbi:MAG: sulfotransferase domain-containing protein [Elainellaceae cyanobacterium]
MNIFHCCVQKTASQWIASIFRKPEILDGTNLRTYDYYKKVMQGREEFDIPPPPNTVLTPVYASYSSFEKIPKPEDYRVFTVIRDPRDIVVSWYFSATLTHGTKHNEMLHALREDLKSMPLQEGLMFSIDKLHYLFESLLSWKQAESLNSRVKVFKYEDLTQGNQLQSFKALFEHCEIPVSELVLQETLNEYSFKKLTKRQVGQEDVSSHLRKGLEGDWTNYFSELVSQKFANVTDNLSTLLGYESTEKCLLRRQYSLIEQKIDQKEKSLSDTEDDLPISLHAQRQIYKLQEERERLQEEGERLQERIKSLQVQLSQSNAERNTAQEALRQLERELTILQAEFANLKNHSTSLEASLNRANQTIERVKDRVNRLGDRNRKLKHTLGLKNSTLQAYKSEIAAIKSSRLWKLRSLWLSFKSRLTLAKPARLGNDSND